MAFAMVHWTSNRQAWVNVRRPKISAKVMKIDETFVGRKKFYNPVRNLGSCRIAGADVSSVMTTWIPEWSIFFVIW